MAQILAVDEDAGERLKIEDILRRAGHVVVPTAIGKDAKGLASDRRFDLALVNYKLQEDDGISLLKQLREIQPACLRILLAVDGNEKLVKAAIDGGQITQVIATPILEESRLAQKVDEALRARQRLSEVARVQEKVARDQEKEMLVECLEKDIWLAIQPIKVAKEPKEPEEPIRKPKDRKIFAYECLLRSNHPVLNGPLPVLVAAERHDVLQDIARVVLQRAVGLMKRLPEEIKLFVNLHPDELAKPGTIMQLLAPLAPWAERVVLEITDRSRDQGMERWQESVKLVKAQGFSFAVDDLGAGQRSLNVLAELDPRYVKIDMGIVRGVDADERKRRLIEMLCDFAKATQAEVIAEGVETEEETKVLQECGVHFLQGYLYGRPSFNLAT
jgi:EAL domain-containing protein (putative c-di-GMP-specific phosphodiesterase class I)/CheY-like chemotaxis protein